MYRYIIQAVHGYLYIYYRYARYSKFKESIGEKLQLVEYYRRFCKVFKEDIPNIWERIFNAQKKRKNFPLSAARIRVINGSVGRRLVTNVTRSIYANYVEQASRVGNMMVTSAGNKASAKREPHNYGCGYSIGWHIVLPRHEYSFSLNYKLWNVTRNVRMCATFEANRGRKLYAKYSEFDFKALKCHTIVTIREIYLDICLILNNLRFFL